MPSKLQANDSSVLIYGGLRRKELLDLRVDDVDLAEGRLLIRSGKGRKSRSLYLPEECVEALRAWLAVRQGMGCRHPYLFTTDPRRRMGDNGLNRIMAAVRTMAGAPPRSGGPGDRRHIMPHAIRHGVATRLLQNGADLRSIQSILGHSDLKTTSMYLHTDELQLKKAADLTRFRNRDRRQVSEERRRPESKLSGREADRPADAPGPRLPTNSAVSTSELIPVDNSTTGRGGLSVSWNAPAPPLFEFAPISDPTARG